MFYFQSDQPSLLFRVRVFLGVVLTTGDLDGVVVDLRGVTVGHTLLSLGCLRGDMAIARLLLECGSDPNQTRSRGERPIHTASTQGSFEMVQLLLQHGSLVNARMEQGWTALLIAVATGNFDIARLVLENGADSDLAQVEGATPVIFAALAGRADLVQLLIDYGANIDLAADSGATALHLAAEKGFTGICRALILEGADVDLQMANGARPLSLAAQNGHADIVRLLIEAGVDLYSLTHAFLAAQVALVYRTAQVADRQTYTGILSLLGRMAIVQDDAGDFPSLDGGVVEAFRFEDQLIQDVVLGTLRAPVLQWLPIISAAKRESLKLWLQSVIDDQRACYASFFHGTGGDEMQELTEYKGPIGESIAGYLVHPRARTRKIVNFLLSLIGSMPLDSDITGPDGALRFRYRRAFVRAAIMQGGCYWDV